MTAHQQAILEHPLAVLVREVLLGMDLDTMEALPKGGYKITIPPGPLAPKDAAEARFWGSSHGDEILFRDKFLFPEIEWWQP